MSCLLAPPFTQCLPEAIIKYRTQPETTLTRSSQWTYLYLALTAVENFAAVD